MKKRVFLIPALCLVFLLSACAETPTQENVVGKDRKELEEKINAAPAEIDDPNPLIDEEGQDLSLEQYSFMSDDGIVQYRFTGTAKLLDVERIPVLLAEIRFRTPGEVEKICRVLCGDNPIYEYTEQMTKPNLEEEILQIRKSLDPDAMYEYYQGNSELIEQAKQFLEQRLELLEEQYQTASDQIGYQPCNFIFMPDSYWHTTSGLSGGDGDSITAVSEVDGVPMYMQEFQHNGTDYRMDNYYYYPDERSAMSFGKKAADIYQKEPITEEDAQDYIAKIEATLDKMGIGTWKCSGYRIDETEFYGRPRYSLYTEWTPYYEGIPVTKQPQIWNLKSDGVFVAKYRYEELSLEYTSGRVIIMTYFSPLGVKEIVNENVEILPYDEIMDRIIKQLAMTYTKQSVAQSLEWILFDPETGNLKPLEGATVLVKGIELGYVRINVPDSETEFYFVPGWTVTGTLVPGNEYVNEDVLHEEWVEESTTTLLCINAIDGSVIDVTKGY